MPDNGAIHLGGSQSGVGDLRIFHDGSNSYIKESGTGDLYITNGNDNSIIAKTDGAVELYHNGSMKLDTRSSGVGIGGDLFFVDSSRIYMGSSNDFLFFMTVQNSQIVNATGNLVYRSDTHHFKDKDNGDTHAKICSRWSRRIIP